MTEADDSPQHALFTIFIYAPNKIAITISIVQVRTQAFGQRMRLIVQVRTKLCGH